MEYKNEVKRPDDDYGYGCGKDGCDRECSFSTNVHVPVEIEPEAKIGRIEIECCGNPKVECECTDKGVKTVIVQNLFVKIPICYDVKVKTGKSHTECDCDKRK